MDDPNRVIDLDPTARPSSQYPGVVIGGRYKLLEQIGEGGMGTVWLAEQLDPIKRRVALKLIKPGMDSREVLARFDAERQALALMDHPHIAHVYDGGLTDDSRPFFVMEYVKGVPITDYCDSARLSIRERLALFSTVCQAVQHAHQKGIIHRDLKPSNLLIGLHDDHPVVKVIDFGLAKAMHQPLTERTLFTAHGQMVGTPLYMSPEQAEHNNLDVDTRSDIYSLGVVLYELLTGATPIERQRLKDAAWQEIVRLIREDEPLKPSLKLSGSDVLPSLAAQRRAEPAQLSRAVKGDLDWITLKSLEKERSRRYATANALARDIERYLADEPVEASPPSVRYRISKFVRRNRGPVAATALVIFVLIGGIVGTTRGLFQTERARRAEASQRTIAERNEQKALAAVQAEVAERQRANDAQQAEAKRAESERLAKEEAQKRLVQVEKAMDLLASIFRELNPVTMEKDGKPLRAMLGERLDRAAREISGDSVGDDLAVARLQMILGESQLGLGYPDKAEWLFAKARQTLASQLGSANQETLVSMNMLAVAYDHASRFQDAATLLEETVALKKEALGPDHPSTLSSMNNLAIDYERLGMHEKAIALHEETLGRKRLILAADDPSLLSSMNNLALAYKTAGKLEQATTMYEQTLKLAREKLGAENPRTLATMSNLAGAYLDTSKVDEALALGQEALKRQTAVLGREHPDTLRTMSDLGAVYRRAGKLDLGIPLAEEALRLRTARLGPEHLDTIASLNNLGMLYLDQGQLDRATPMLEESLKVRKFKLGANHPLVVQSMNNLASAYDRAGSFVKAEPLYRDLLDEARQRLGRDDARTTSRMADVGRTLLEQRKWNDAEPVLQECVEILKQSAPDAWTTFNVESLLGLALLGAKKYSDAEGHLLAAYEGLKQRQSAIPAERQTSLPNCVRRLIDLYTAWERPEDTAKWTKTLDEQ